MTGDKQQDWSQWLDFDKANAESMPESAGVFVMHANMKVIYIGASQNIRSSLIERLSDECTGKAKRFRYMLASPGVKEMLLKEYAEKHAGKLPICNET